MLHPKNSSNFIIHLSFIEFSSLSIIIFKKKDYIQDISYFIIRNEYYSHLIFRYEAKKLYSKIYFHFFFVLLNKRKSTTKFLCASILIYCSLFEFCHWKCSRRARLLMLADDEMMTRAREREEGKEKKKFFFLNTE